MTGIAQGLSRSVNVVKQSGLGVLGSTGSQTIRRTSGIGSAVSNMYKSAEIVTHRQSTGSSYGLLGVTFKHDGELSALTYKVYEEAMLMAAYATGGTLTASDIAATVGTFTSVAAAFLTAGFKQYDVVRASGFTGASTNSNARNFWITALTAGVMTGVFLDGTVQVADAAGESVTIAVVGKKLMPPLTGHTRDYLTIEDAENDLGNYDLFGDQRPATIDYDCPATGNATFSCGLVGRTRVPSASQTLTSPSAETTTGIMSAINGRLFVNGAEVIVTGIKISLANSAAGTSAEMASNFSGDVTSGVLEVTGTFSAKCRDQVVTLLYAAQSEISIGAVLCADKTATSDFKGFSLGKVRITGDAPNDGMQDIYRTYPFVARLNSTGGAALALDKTIFTVQDSAVS